MSTDLDNLRAFRAADGAPDADARAAARVALLERIEGTAAPRPALPRRRLFAGAVALAGAAVLATAFISGLGSGGVQPTEATAAQLLHRAADIAANGPDVVLRPGQYWYTRSESTSEDSTYDGSRSFSVLLHIRRESWIDANGGGRVRQYSVGAPRFVGSGGRAAWIAAGRPKLGLRMDVPLVEEDGSVPRRPYPFGSGGLSYVQLRALPPSTGALYARIERAAAENDNSAGDPHEMFTIVGDLLREAPTTAALRAALYRVAARIPGVTLLGEVRDAARRPGVAIALRGRHGQRFELIFDPRTAELLGERAEMRGQPAFESAYLESGVVDSTRSRP